MKEFAALLDRLYYTYGNLAKARILADYFLHTPDPERGYALAVIAGTLDMPQLKRGMMSDLIKSRVDPVLFEMSYDYVGELSETVAHIWPGKERVDDLPPLSQVITAIRSLDKEDIPHYIASLLDVMDSTERWALMKLGMGSLRIGISARFIKQVLADYGSKDIQEIESVWHGIDAPYEQLFAWLEGKADKPFEHHRANFQPVMLSHALEEKDHSNITPEDFSAEWKFDGIRIQLVSTPHGQAVYTRTGDEISGSFPEILERANFHAVLDGELLVKSGDSIGSFNDLQQRLNRKSPSKKMIAANPAHIVVYDMLFAGDEDLRNLPFTERRRRITEWFNVNKPEGMEISEALPFSSFEELKNLRASEAYPNSLIEGLMLKRKDSKYISGRPSGLWYKWKRDPMLVDAVMMYAQRGHGKRSSLYSDYTYGLWKGNEILPIGKAYFGFTDEELKQLDKWVRHHTINTFGPVREVEKELVLEIAFDSVNRSKRHKSGFALRFPRINRIRWDKPAQEADKLDALEKLVDEPQ